MYSNRSGQRGTEGASGVPQPSTAFATINYSGNAPPAYSDFYVGKIR